MKRHLSDLRPTQFAVGMAEVDHKLKRIRDLGEKELAQYLDEHPVPVVLCSQGNAHIIDHHHLVRACWELGIPKVVTELKADLSHLSEKDFWEEMVRLKWVHLHDQLGNGPHSPQLLPREVRGLADDPYRSLAWAVREAGGFEKVPIPFFEFRWADFFRKKLVIERTREGFENAFEKAMKLSSTPEASHLPGHRRGSGNPGSLDGGGGGR